MGGQERVGKGRQDEADTLLATLTSAEAITDPYPLYARLRTLAPAHRAPSGAVFVTRYEDCARILRDPRVSVEYQNADVDPRTEMVEAFGYERSERGRRGILNLDPPDHTRIRRLAQQAFTPRRVETLLARIQALVDEMLPRLPASCE